MSNQHKSQPPSVTGQITLIWFCAIVAATFLTIAGTSPHIAFGWVMAYAILHSGMVRVEVKRTGKCAELRSLS
jgi:hypothetical protein